MMPSTAWHKEAQPGFAPSSCAPSSDNASALNKALNNASDHSIPQQVKTFLRMLYEQQMGWVELAWIDGDPDAGVPMEHTWLRYGGDQTPVVLQRIARLCARRANVYVSACLYAAPRRSASVLPTRAIVVDDLPADQSCACFVQTSLHGRQGYFLLTEAVDGDTRRDLARRAAYALGGDHGGWDNQQLVRVPGGWNTKARHGAPFQTTLQLATRQRHSRAQLAAQWPVVAAVADHADLDWPQVEHWLANMDVLLNADGVPRRVKPMTQTATILRHGHADTSLARYIVAKGLVLHGYPDTEIAALLLHLCAYDSATTKGSAWLETDVARVIGRVRQECPNNVPTPTQQRGQQSAVARAVVQPLRRGRKIALTPAQLLQFYQRTCHASDVVMLTVREVAAQLGVSVATVTRCERVLRADGTIERHLFNRRQSSMVVLNTPAADARPVTHPCGAAAPAATPAAVPAHGAATTNADGAEAVDARPVTIVAPVLPTLPAHVPSDVGSFAHLAAENDVASQHEGTHPQASTPPTPRSAVAAAFAHFAERPRISRQMVRMFLDSAYPALRLGAPQLAQLVAAERKREQWQRQVAALQTMPYPALLRLERRVERIQVAQLCGQAAPQHRWADALSPHIHAELERREPMQERASPQRLRKQEAEYRQLVEADRQQRRQRPTPAAAPAAAGADRGCVPPAVPATQLALFAAPAALPTAAERLIAHLRALPQRGATPADPPPDTVPHTVVHTVAHTQRAASISGHPDAPNDASARSRHF